jgi:hypothetical protein
MKQNAKKFSPDTFSHHPLENQLTFHTRPIYPLQNEKAAAES